MDWALDRDQIHKVSKKSQKKISADFNLDDDAFENDDKDDEKAEWGGLNPY